MTGNGSHLDSFIIINYYTWRIVIEPKIATRNGNNNLGPRTMTLSYWLIGDRVPNLGALNGDVLVSRIKTGFPDKTLTKKENLEFVSNSSEKDPKPDDFNSMTSNYIGFDCHLATMF